MTKCWCKNQTNSGLNSLIIKGAGEWGVWTGSSISSTAGHSPQSPESGQSLGNGY